MHFAKQYATRAETVDVISKDSHAQTTLAIFPALNAVIDPNDTTTVTTSAPVIQILEIELVICS